MGVPAIGSLAHPPHKNNKSLRNTEASFSVQKGAEQPAQEHEIEALARLLAASSRRGSILRTLVRHMREPRPPHVGEDVSNLLLLALAVKRNQQRGIPPP